MTQSPPNPYQPIPAANLPTTSTSPTKVRYGVLGFSITMSILLYLDRFALSVAVPVIQTELNLDEKQIGRALSAFFYVYAFAQVPAGWLSQRFGPRMMLGLYVFIWSLAVGGMGLATGLSSLIFCRWLLGLSQAGAYPVAGSYIKHWFPLESRGFANSFTAMGGRLGGLLSNIVTPNVMLLFGIALGIATGKWRLVFVTYAVLGIIWSIAFWWWFRNSPSEHPSCNEGERRLIEGSVVAPTADAKAPAASGFEFIGAMARSPTIWFMCMINIFVNVGWIFLAAWLPKFLKSGFPSLELTTIGWLAAAPGLASMCGGLSGGIATDRLVRRFGLKWGRRLTGIVATSGAATAYFFAMQSESLVAYICLFAAVGFTIDFGLGSLWAVYQDISGKNVATVLGFANMCGNLAAGIFIDVIGGYAKANDWRTVFMISSGALLITMVCWFFVNPEKKLTAD